MHFILCVLPAFPSALSLVHVQRWSEAQSSGFWISASRVAWVLWHMAKAGCFEVETPRLCELPGTLPALFVRAPGTLGWLLNTRDSWNEMSFNLAKLGSWIPIQTFRIWVSPSLSEWKWFSGWTSSKWEGDFPANPQFMSEKEKQQQSMILLRVWFWSSCFHFSSTGIPT